MKTYKYIGDGAGVPGLPHVITDVEAETLGVTKLLQEAIANGSYVTDDAPLKTSKKKEESEVSNG